MSDLIHRVNVGDSLTRGAAARPGTVAVVDAGRLRGEHARHFET